MIEEMGGEGLKTAETQVCQGFAGYDPDERARMGELWHAYC